MKKLIVLSALLMWCMAAFALSHKVARGETLESIAAKYNVTEAQLIEANPGAANLFYVGLVLNIPENTTAPATQASQPASPTNQNISVSQNTTNNNVGNSYSFTNVESDDAFEKERKDGAFELSYCAGSFEDVKSSGSYGFGWSYLPWKLAPRFYAGIHFSPLNFNFGLVPSSLSSDIIKLGPTIGYYFTPKIFAMMPLDVLCRVYFDNNDKMKTSWAMSLAPKLYIGSGGGVFIGPQITIPFIDGAEVSCGFRAGIYF